ncbi:MAG TPA: hypothetical protein VH817_15820 [Thermoleophilaceae bacterium]|jgi:hypothetical protein
MFFMWTTGPPLPEEDAGVLAGVLELLPPPLEPQPAASNAMAKPLMTIGRLIRKREE